MRQRKKRRKLRDALVPVNNTDNNEDVTTASDQTETPTTTNNSRPSKFLALPPSGFRMERCCLSSALTDAADDDERTCWKDNLLPVDCQCDNLEDSKGHYKLLGCNKTSSDLAVAAAFKQKKSIYMGIARTHHPDKSKDKEMNAKFDKAHEVYEQQKAALEVIGKLNIDGSAYPHRADYDREGESLRNKFKEEFTKVYPDSSFANRVKVISEEKTRAAIFAKGQATHKQYSERDKGTLDDVARLWDTVGQQNNECRLAIYNAIKDGGHSTAAISRYVRLSVFSTKKKPWNGVAHNNKIFKIIQSTICRVKIAMKKGKMNGVVNGGGRNDKGRSTVLKSKSVSAGVRGRKILSKKRAVSDMYEMLCVSQTLYHHSCIFSFLVYIHNIVDGERTD